LTFNTESLLIVPVYFILWLKISLAEESGENHTAEVTLINPASNLTVTVFTISNGKLLLIFSLHLSRPPSSFLEDSKGKPNNHLDGSI